MKKFTLRGSRYAASWKAPAALMLVTMYATSPAMASEGGGNQYPAGSETIDVALRPPPGHVELLAYNEFYEARLYSGPKEISDSHVGAFVSVVRLFYSWPTTLDNGAITFDSAGLVGVGHLGITVPTPSGSLSAGSTSAPDPAIFPVEVTYHGKKFVATTTVAVWIPLGSYDKSNPLNPGLGKNHYTFVPAVWLTYFLNKKTQIDMALNGEFSTVNPHTHYTSGDDVILTTSVSYAVTPHIQFGPVAYYFQQFTNDTQPAVTIHKGDRGQALGVGAQIIYNFSPGKAVVLKYYHESFVQNRPGGNEVWFEFAIPIGG